MKVLYLNNNYRGEGTFNRCFRIGRELVKKGVEVTILTITGSPPQREVKRSKVEGVELIELPAMSRRRDYLGYILRPRLARKIALAESFDLVHAFTAAEPLVWYPAMALHEKRKQAHFPLVVDWDDWYSKGGLVELKPAKFILRSKTEHWEESLPKVADAVTVVSEALEERAAGLGVAKDRIHLIGNGADPEAFTRLDRESSCQECGLPSDKVLFTSMGSYNHALPIAIRAFFQAAGDNQDVHFVCVGDVSLKHQHLQADKDLISKAKHDPRFHFMGVVEGKQVPKFLAASDVLLLPMADTVIERARYPIRLGDYLASERAVVASEVGEVGRVLREYECGLLAKDEDEFARRLTDLIANPDRRRHLGFLAHRTALNHLQWESLADRMLKVYEGLLKKEKGKGKKK